MVAPPPMELARTRLATRATEVAAKAQALKDSAGQIEARIIRAGRCQTELAAKYRRDFGTTAQKHSSFLPQIRQRARPTEIGMSTLRYSPMIGVRTRIVRYCVMIVFWILLMIAFYIGILALVITLIRGLLS